MLSLSCRDIWHLLGCHIPDAGRPRLVYGTYVARTRLPRICHPVGWRKHHKRLERLHGRRIPGRQDHRLLCEPGGYRTILSAGTTSREKLEPDGRLFHIASSYFPIVRREYPFANSTGNHIISKRNGIFQQRPTTIFTRCYSISRRFPV